MARRNVAKAKALQARINYMMENKVESHVIDLPLEKRLFPKYDKALVMVMYGEPVADSRPRFKKDGDGTYNPHKAYLMRVFNKLYQEDDMLLKTVIDTPCGVILRNYVTPEKKMQKAIGVDIVDETHISIKQKDNDNIEKVHWDVLQDKQFSVLLDDKLVTHNSTCQFYSLEPRIEIEIQFPSKEMLEKEKKYFMPYLETIKMSASYKAFRLYPKYIFTICNTSDKKFPETFFNNLSEVNLTAKQVGYILKDLYNAKRIEQLATYCKLNTSTRIANTVNLLDVIKSETYPVTKKKLRRLK